MSRPLRLAAVALLLAACSCAKKEAVPGKYAFRFERLAPGTQLLVQGKPAGTLDKSSSLELTLPAGVYFSDGKQSVSARVATPCGPRDVPLGEAAATITLQNEKMDRESGGTYRNSWNLPESFVTQRVRIDRSRAPDAKVTIGALELTPSMVPWGVVHLLWPDCAEGRSVQIDGREVGKLPDAQPDAQDLILATTPGCYYFREVAYGASRIYGEGDVAVPKSQMFWVRRLDYFLEKAPDTTIGEEGSGEIKLELTASDCRRKVPTRR